MLGCTAVYPGHGGAAIVFVSPGRKEQTQKSDQIGGVRKEGREKGKVTDDLSLS